MFVKTYKTKTRGKARSKSTRPASLEPTTLKKYQKQTKDGGKPRKKFKKSKKNFNS